MATNWAVFPEGTEPSKSVAALAEQVGRDGGRVLAIYQEPLNDAWQIFALLPLAQVEPTPYQLDLSKPHVITDTMAVTGFLKFFVVHDSVAAAAAALAA